MHRAPLTPRVFALTLALSACDSATTALRDAGTEPPAPVLVSIDVTAAARMIAKGETLALVATGRWDDGTTRALTEGVAWSSSNALVATVDATGVVTAIDVGESVLTAAVDDVRGTLTLTVVRSALTTLAIEPATVTIDRGATTTLVARGTFEDGTTRDVSSAVEWSSSATEIATVTEGVVTGLTTGDAIISVRDAASGISSDSRSATVTVVEPRPTSVRVDPVGVTLPVGETQPFTATAVYADGSTVDVTTSVSWASSNTSVATIANAPPSSGVAVAIGAGVTSITATDRATGLVGSVSLIVTEARLATLEITPRTATIAVGARTNLIATGLYTSGATIDVTRRVTWTSSDPAVATVDTRGQVTPLRAGLTTISARDATSGLDTTTLGTSARITVTPATVTSVAVLPLSATLAVGDTLQLQGLALYTDQTSRDCTATGAWSSSAPAIASVDATGLVTALSAGTVTISIVDDVSGVASGARSAQLVVAPPALRALAVTPPTSAIVTGYTRQLVAVGTFSDGSSAPVIATRVMWRSSATSVATVSASGVVTAVAPGLATISVSDLATLVSSDTSATSALISVSNANLLSLAIVPTSTTIPAGADLALVALGSYDDGSTEDLTNVVTWASSTSTVARVSNTAGERGRVTAVGAGSTLVTVTDTTTGITSLPGSSAWISVDPTVTLSSVVVTPRTASIVGGQTIRFAAEATFSDGARHAVSDGVAWSSSSPLVASISSSASTAGVATGLTDGTTVISALHTPTGVASGAASATLTVLRPTLQDFDGATGAPYTLAHHLGLFSAQVLAGGPTGSFLRLAQDGTTDTVNSIAFQRSGVGAAPVRVVLDFDFRFAGSGCSADGFGVLYLPTSMHGTSGPAPQFDEEPELPQAIGVGLDLYDNAPELFGGNQVSLHWNGALISEQDGIIPMANGQFHHARITLRANGATTLVDVVLSVPGGSATPVVTGTAIPAALYEGRFAIAARTGGCTAHHDIDNVAVRHE